MFITREADYAVRCVLSLSGHEALVSSRQIAERMRIPQKFLAKILQRLVRSGILSSGRGVRGGFRLGRPAAEISLLAVVEAIQGPSAANRCAIEPTSCSLSETCVIHPIWVELRTVVEQKLASTSFAELAGRVGPLPEPPEPQHRARRSAPRRTTAAAAH